MSKEIHNNPSNGNVLNTFRQEISDLCRQAADKEENLYRLTVPTGAGKTLSSLRFALYHAKKMKKQHIIYIAPFNSILIQNAEEIRKAIGKADVVLEHHCNVVCEEGEEDQYRKLTETWDSPIIVTTAVQILNTLFSAQKSCIRRMHTLCNSIIIFDEVQAIPVKCMELFNLAVNFLTQFCGTTVVLCSATQPTLAPIKENNICECIEMAGRPEKYANAFKRTDIKDAIELYPGGMEIEDLSEFVKEKTEQYQSTLVILNTTACAMNTFQQLKAICPQEYELFHLSNNMCPQHKLDTLKSIKQILNEQSKKIICVSTQVVEAGVNFSFGCVVRSKAGLDNIIQAAGRCNRHKELGRMGTVFIVQMSEKAEKLSHLQEIRNAQAALQKVLEDYKNNSLKFRDTLDSEEAIKAYYLNYYSQLRTNETKFLIDKQTTTIIELLGENKVGQLQYIRRNGEKVKTKLPQAFLTAGQAFEVISNDYKEGRKVISSIEDELLKCDKFDISVAFITDGGIAPLLQTLKTLEERGIKGRILTTDYLEFSDPKALRKLAELNNIELKMYMTEESGEGFHTKGYIFKDKDIYRIITGSSNMTQKALSINREWNTKIVSTEYGEYVKEILSEFESLWNSKYS